VTFNLSQCCRIQTGCHQCCFHPKRTITAFMICKPDTMNPELLSKTMLLLLKATR
ncbi:unnamed protein product, partial [Musa banksii]